MYQRYKIIFAILLLIVFNIYFWSVVFSLTSKKSKICFLDVGQGDSELIKLPYGVNFLFDTGPKNKKVISNLENNLPFFKKRIEAVFISHTDFDHWGGLDDIINNYQINSFFWNNFLPKNNNLKQKFLKELSFFRKNNILVKTLHYPNQIEYAGYRFYILWPEKNSQFKSTNNNSLVILVKNPENKRVLLTGDIQKSAQKQIFQKFGNFLKADILKAPHHGAKSSLEKDFFKAIQPKKVAIEVGKNNPYHHPAKETLNFFSMLGARIYRTDLNKTFCFNF